MAEKKENKVEEPKVDNTVEKIKIKKKPKKFERTPDIIKVDMSKPVEKPVEEPTKVDLKKDNDQETVDKPAEPQQVLEEIKEEEVKVQAPPKPILPEGVEKLVNFMEETGGDISDYIKLNQNYDEWDDDALIKAHYQKTKPHLNDDEILFMIEDNFKYDESTDDEKEIKRKKLALKEQVASAKTQLEEYKSKYYEDIKMGSKLNEEQQNAMKFFNESKERQQMQEQAQSAFLELTDQVFNNEFKGFEYQVGDKRFRYNVSDAEKVKTTQSDINNFVKKFLNENNQMENASGYHKGLFTAMNSDAIASHFYEQGKADALKESIAKSKNINMDPRQQHSSEVNTGGVKVRVLNNDNSNRATFKIKKRK
tara:strand:- start:759 stop:1856 length:1098 start_codon:yes stop_codon:yes gene_type:complete